MKTQAIRNARERSASIISHLDSVLENDNPEEEAEGTVNARVQEARHRLEEAEGKLEDALAIQEE